MGYLPLQLSGIEAPAPVGMRIPASATLVHKSSGSVPDCSHSCTYGVRFYVSLSVFFIAPFCFPVAFLGIFLSVRHSRKGGSWKLAVARTLSTHWRIASRSRR